ncbi:MAG: lipid A biosynthesis lauroyl acyltransferase [Pseudomonadota bacterium]
MNPSIRPALREFLAPRFWGVWLGFSLLRGLSWLPFEWQMRLGGALGRLAQRGFRKRAQVASRNLRLCFPEHSDATRQQCVRAHFENLGRSVFEMGMAYYRPQRLLGRITVSGAEHLDACTPGATILLTAHFGALEVGGTYLKSRGLAFDAVYRNDRNPLVTELIRRGREQSGRQVIEKSNIKQMVRSLRQQIPVWYAPDQSYRRKHSAELPFFGVPAMTNTATSALARLGKATVVGFFVHRRDDLSGYEVIVHPPLEDFPGNDAATDTLRIQQLFEQEVRRSPAQYFWVHRKFKGRSDALPDAYADLSNEVL